jgi:TatD DNase family protein
MAFGIHPEGFWDEREAKNTRRRIRNHRSEIVAIGEVGLPYYSLSKARQSQGPLAVHLKRLEPFVALAQELDLPLILHAVHQSVAPTLELLQRHGISKAHFHWLKAPAPVVKQLAAADYYISVTPEVCYRRRDQELVRLVPKHLLLVETDAPWPYEGRFAGQSTEPKMVWDAVRTIAQVWKRGVDEVAQQIRDNTRRCFGWI